MQTSSCWSVLSSIAGLADKAQGLNMGMAMEKVPVNPMRSENIDNCCHYIAEEQPEKVLEHLGFLKVVD
jgi:hypothetical protein